MPTARKWELYVSSKDTETKAAVKAAVPALNAALKVTKKAAKEAVKVAIKEGRLQGRRYDRRFYIDTWDHESCSRVVSAIERAVNTHLLPVQCQHGKSGSADSEPSWVAFAEVRKAICSVVNVDPDEAHNYFPRW